MDVFEALEKARDWRNVTFAFLVLELLGFVAVDIFLVGLIGVEIVEFLLAAEAFYIIWPCVFLFVAYKYMKELEAALASVGVGGAEAGYIYPDRVFVK